MNIFCEKCGKKINALDLYCVYCGVNTPSKTVMATEPVEYTDGNYCPSCSAKGPKNGLFCGSCGKSMFEKPGVEIFCPLCGEKNKVSSNNCFSCRFSFKNWFQLRGEAAVKAGYKGELSIKEKMNNIKYNFLERDIFTIGRNKVNNMVIPCGFVSGNHLVIDIKNSILKDFQSSNNTYINRSPEPIPKIELDLVNELAVAGLFVFTIVKMENAFVLRLTAIIDEDECIANGDKIAFERLRKEYFILLGKGKQKFFIRKEDGKIKAEPDKNREFYQIEYDNGYYYYSDEKRGLKNQILFKTLDNWSVNWVVEK